jgi:hypothetical protein
MSRTRSKIKCASCGGRIHQHEPDLVLRDLENAEQPRYFHTRCGGAAYRATMTKPSLYRITVRHVEEAAN